MPKFIAVRGINARRYFMAQVEAETPEAAFAAARVLLEPEHAGKWSPDFERSDKHNSMGHINDLLEPPTASEETLSITDASNEIHIDFTDIPNEVEPACYTDLLAFARRMARMTTPEDEFAEDPQGCTDAEELVRYMDGDRLFGEYQAFMSMVREARALLKFPKE